MKKYFSATDFFITIIIFSISLIIIFFSAGKSKKGGEIVIEVAGKVFASYKMEGIKDSLEVPIKTKYGNNILLIEKDGAKMIYSDCLGQNDVKQGKITEPGRMIVCAPHKLVVYITGKSNEDAVTR